MDFHILGPIEAIDADAPLALGGSKQRALLGMLLLHAGEVVPSDLLIEELWPGERRADALKALQVAVSRLRKALEPARPAGVDSRVLVTRPPGYELRVDPERLDAKRFEALLDEGRGALAAGQAQSARATLGEALSLWRGAPLADLAYESFCQAEVARLEELRTAALEERIAADLALGRHAELVAELRTLVKEEPMRERLHGQLMLGLYRSGRQAEALDAYAEARRTLVEELGIEPSRELRDLHQAILEQSPELDLPARPETAADTAGSVFVGREPQLAELLAGLDEALAGRGRLFLLAGEPGIGKSRLAEQLAAQAKARGAEVLVGRCWEAGGAPAYWPWVQALRTYVRELDADVLRAQLGPGAAELAQLIPELRARLSDLPEPLAFDSETARFRLFDATTEFLRNASLQRPILLLLDDLHAADAPSLLLLQFLVRELGETRVLLVAVYRDVAPIPGQTLMETLAAVIAEPVTRRLTLDGLSAAEVGEYVEATASEIASAELVEALHAETEGNPLFFGEMVRLLRVEGVSAESTTDVRLGIPQSIRDVIARRLSHLSEECNRILVLASVIGREFGLEALARMGGTSEEELLDTLDEAMAARVVSGGLAGTARLRFSHVLIRDTLYEGLTSARRVRLHRLLVDALETLYGDEPGPHLTELAHHSIAGRDLEKGLRYASRAGDRAQALLAYEEAARLYEMALDTLSLARPLNEQARCELLISLGQAKARAGDSLAARRAFFDAASIARRLNAPRELARAAAGYGGRFMWARAGRDDRLRPLLEEGLAALPAEEVELRAMLLSRLAGVLRDEHSRDHRDRLSREAVELARRTGNPTALAHALDGRLAAISAPDTIAECLALVRELREVAERIADPERVANALDHKRTRYVMVGDLREAEAALETEAHLFTELRQPGQQWQVYSARAMFALAAGRLAEAEELISQAFALGEAALPDVAIPVYRLQCHGLRDLQGRLPEVAPAIRDLVTEYPTRPVFRCVLGHVHAKLGHPAEARQAFDYFARDHFAALPFDQEWLYGVSLLAETADLLGDSVSSAVLYRLLVPWAAFSAADHPEGFRGSAARYLGMLATIGKRWDDAELHFEDALAMNASMGARPWLAHTEHDYARMLRARDGQGDRERAQELLNRALETYRALGMDTYAAAAAALAKQVGVNTSGRRRERPVGGL
jgi:DNA-binding SARP family transcriptional activator/tetratricopeptide (TPR) repeat protein